MQTIIISISQVCYARVLDYRRKFIEAAQRYIDLSYRTAIHDEERMTALKHALICTMLASAGMPAALVKINDDTRASKAQFKHRTFHVQLKLILSIN